MLFNHTIPRQVVHIHLGQLCDVNASVREAQLCTAAWGFMPDIALLPHI